MPWRPRTRAAQVTTGAPLGFAAGLTGCSSAALLQPVSDGANREDCR